MERTGSNKKIQGGGDGVGFRAPRQMLRMDPDRYLKILRESIIRAGLKLEEEKNVTVGTGNVDEMKRHKMKAWLDVLSSRFLRYDAELHRHVSAGVSPAMHLNEILNGRRNLPEIMSTRCKMETGPFLLLWGIVSKIRQEMGAWNTEDN